MVDLGPIDNEKDRQYANEFSKDLYKYFINGERGTIEQRHINTTIAFLARQNPGSFTNIYGKVTTTQHNEKIILEINQQRNPVELKSFTVDVSEKALDMENYDKDVFIVEMGQWILNQARKMRDEAERRCANHDITIREREEVEA